MPSGGPRPNSGRPRKGQERPKQILAPVETKPVTTHAELEKDLPASIALLRAMVSDESLDVRYRLDAAKALAPYEARKVGETGVKEEREKTAKEKAKKFQAITPPRLVNG